MSKLISRLMYSTSDSPAISTFSIRSSPHTPGQFLVHPIGYPADVPPIFTIVISLSKPNVSMFRAYPDQTNKIGDAITHSFSSTIDLTHRGHQVKLKQNLLSGNLTLDTPVGRYKWIVGQLMGSTLELKDGSGIKLAVLKSAGFPGSGERKLELFTPVDDVFLELIVLSGIAAKNSQNQTLGLEAASAVACI